MIKRQHPDGLAGRTHSRSLIICSDAGCRAIPPATHSRNPIMARRLSADVRGERNGRANELSRQRAENPTGILCIGMPVRDLTFRIQELPKRGFKVNASHFDEICGGNALNAAIGIVRLGGRASICGPMGDARETSARYIFDKLAHEGIDTKHIVHMPGLVTPISKHHDRPERRTHHRDISRSGIVESPPARCRQAARDCAAILTENRCAEFCTDLCAEARRRGIPVIVDVDRTMSMREGLLTASSHLVFSSEALQSTAGVANDADALLKIAKLTSSFLAGTQGAQGTLWLDEHQSLQQTPASRCIPWIPLARATCSTAHSPSPSPKSRIWFRPCGSHRPPRR